MDTEKSAAEEQMEELRRALKEFNTEKVNAKSTTRTLGGYDSVDMSTIFNTSMNSGSYGADTITVTSPTYSIGAGLGISGVGASVFTVNGANSPNWTNTNPWATTTSQGQLNLDGAEADIKINGKSLMDTLTKLEERLNILTPNPEMEKEWDELRELGKRYREVEAKLREQKVMWDKLKSMPPPDPLY